MRKEIKQFSINLKRIRTASGMSQSHLAILLKVDKGYISRLETGNKNPTLSTIAKLAEAIGVSVGELMK